MLSLKNNTKELLRGEKQTDFDDIYELNKLAFGTDAESKLINELRKTRNYIKGLSIVLLIEEKIIGHAMLTHAHIANRGRRFGCLALGPMAILPEYQRRGYGTKLLEEALLRAKECGYKAIVVLGHSEYYPKFGFIPASNKNIRTRFNVPAENFMVLELAPNALKGITGLAEYAKEFNSVMKKDEPAKKQDAASGQNNDAPQDNNQGEKV